MAKKTVEILPAKQEMEQPDKMNRVAAYCRVSTNVQIRAGGKCDFGG